MNWLSNIFGSETLIDSGMSIVDNAFYTNEEKADMKVKLLDAYRPFKLIQRVLATLVAALFAFVLLLLILLVVLSTWWPVLMVTAAKIAALEIVSMLGWSFMAVMSLYFTGGVISSFSSFKKKS